MGMLWMLARDSADFRHMLRGALRTSPCSMTDQWNLIMYVDGTSPQNPLSKGRDMKKVDAVYWSFLDFKELLIYDMFWFTVSATRHERMKGA